MKKFLTLGLVLLLMLSLVGCSDGSTSDNGSVISEITQAYINGEITIDYVDAVSVGLN